LNELPDTLDDTYERTLQGIPKQKRQHAHRLFQCLVAAIRPLQVDELAEIFTIEFDADATYNLVEDWRPENGQEAVLSACTTLISIIGDDEDVKIVQFSHFSVKEFLTSDRFRASDIGNNFHYYIPLDDAHTILARACLTVLLQLDETTDKKPLTKFPLAFYSAWYWVDHAKFGDVASRIQDAMERLFDPKGPYFASWIWIRGSGGKGIQTMDRLAERPSQPEGTPLYYAAYYGFVGLAKQLIVAHGEDVNTKCGRSGSPLHAASGEGHVDVARLLLDHGADVNLRSGYGTMPLGRAYMGRHLEVMRLLLEHGADMETPDDNAFGTLLHDASFGGPAEVVHLLLQHNANVNARGHQNSIPLHFASRSRHTRVVQLLLEHGADVHAKDDISSTSLDWAIYHRYHDIEQLLLEHGAKTTGDSPQ
jgi:Ankyrin repeats (3 copies)/Ankyrin repeats (many copies)